MSDTQLDGLIQLAVAIGILSIGAGALRLPRDPRLRPNYFDPATNPYMRRVFLIGGLCCLVVALASIFGIR